MSWKIIVCTGLLCVVASTAWAQQPTVSAELLGLNTDGNWVWSISVTPESDLFEDSGPNGTPPDTVGGSVAFDFGIDASADRGVISAASNATNFPMDDPGNAPAGWGNDIDGDTMTDRGVRFSTTDDRVTAFLGSDFFDAETAFEALRVVTERPTSGDLATSLSLLGPFGTCAGTTPCPMGGTNGVVAQDGASYSFSMNPTSGVVAGNANLSPMVDVGDLAILASNFDDAGTFRWQDGDFTGNGTVDVGDLAVLAANFDDADPNWTSSGSVTIPVGSASGLASGGVVPEPASLVLVVLSGMTAVMTGRRRRG